MPIPSARATATFTQAGNELGGFVHLALVGRQGGVLGSGEGWVVVLLHQADGFAGDVHVVAHVGLLVCGDGFELLVECDFMAEVFNQFAQSEDRIGLELLGADVVGDRGARVCAEQAGLVYVGIKDFAGAVRRGNELLHISRCNGVVQCIGRGHGADQDQHDQSHTLLSVVGTVEEADAGAGEHQQCANGPRRRCVALRRLVESGVLDGRLRQAGTTVQQRRSR